MKTHYRLLIDCFIDNDKSKSIKIEFDKDIDLTHQDNFILAKILSVSNKTLNRIVDDYLSYFGFCEISNDPEYNETTFVYQIRLFVDEDKIERFNLFNKDLLVPVIKDYWSRDIDNLLTLSYFHPSDIDIRVKIFKTTNGNGRVNIFDDSFTIPTKLSTDGTNTLEYLKDPFRGDTTLPGEVIDVAMNLDEKLEINDNGKIKYIYHQLPNVMILMNFEGSFKDFDQSVFEKRWQDTFTHLEDPLEKSTLVLYKDVDTFDLTRELKERSVVIKIPAFHRGKYSLIEGITRSNKDIITPGKYLVKVNGLSLTLLFHLTPCKFEYRFANDH